MGYTVESPLFITAESIGASHKRERVFVLAHRTSKRWRKDVASAARRRQDADQRGEDVADAASQKRTRLRRRGESECSESGMHGDTAMADAERSGPRGERVSRRGSTRGTEAGRAGEAVADTSGARPQELAGEPRDARQEHQAAERGGVGLFAPGPNADWGAIPAHLWPATQPGVRVVVDGRTVVVDESRADQLRCSGNAVVPLCASFAFVHLVRRSGILNRGSDVAQKKAR